MRKTIIMVIIFILTIVNIGCGNNNADPLADDSITSVNDELDTYASYLGIEAEYSAGDDGEPFYMFVIDDVWNNSDESLMLAYGENLLDKAKQVHEQYFGNDEFAMGIGDDDGHLLMYKLMDSDKVLAY